MTFSTTSIARSSARHPRRVLAIWALALVIAGVIIVLLLSKTLTSQFSFLGKPDAQVGRDLLAQRMNMPQKANEVVIVSSSTLSTTDPAFRTEVLGLQKKLSGLGPGVIDTVVSGYSTGDKRMLSADGHTAILPIVMAGDLTKAQDNIEKVHSIVHAASGKAGFTTLITGTASIGSDFSHQAGTDLQKGETTGGGAALVILLIVFGALVAAMLPLLLGIVAITVAIALTLLVGQTFPLSVFALNMITMMGLATGIDYSLFIVSRFREERARGRDKIEAIVATGGTASRAVFFSGMTVVLALLGMLIVPMNVFTSLATGAILVVAMAMAAALTLLPAVLSLLGDRINSIKVPYLGRRILTAKATGRASWLARVAQRAMHRPALTMVAVAVVLVAAALPAAFMKTGVSGVTTFPDSFQSKQGFVVLNRDFSAGEVAPVQIVVDGQASSPSVKTAVSRLRAALGNDPVYGPSTVQTAPKGDLVLVSAPVAGDSTGSLAIGKVRTLRSAIIPAAFAGSGAHVYVTGDTAGNIDYIDIVNHSFPWVIGLVLGLSFLLLLFAFRSLVVPAVSIVMNLLSVGAAYGLVTLVSLWGYGHGLFGFQKVPVVEQWVPLFLFSVLFGLSMDYQVFLLSRVKEEYERTGDSRAAAVSGIGSTAGIITGAALIMVAVFAGFASGDLVMFQQMGFGLAVAVLLDATLVRSLLVPAAISLLGARTWYLPKWLGWLPRVSFEGPAPADRDAVAEAPATARAAVAGQPEPPEERAA